MGYTDGSDLGVPRRVGDSTGLYHHSKIARWDWVPWSVAAASRATGALGPVGQGFRARRMSAGQEGWGGFAVKDQVQEEGKG